MKKAAMYQKILLPIDGSDTSMHGLNAAIKLAKSHGGQIRLLHIVNEYVLETTAELQSSDERST